MSIKVKLNVINQGGFVEALMGLRKLKLPFSHAWNLKKLLKEMDDVLETSREEYQKISQEFGELKTVEGKDHPEFVFHEGKTQKGLERKGKEFLETEITLTANKIPLSVLQAHKIEVDKLILLEEFLEDDLSK